MLLYCTVLLVLTSEVLGQGAVSTHHRLNNEVIGEAWHYNNFPNPRTEPNKCGRKRTSWICDPDGILKPDHADELDLLIDAIRKATPCPCDVTTCSSNRAGYPISVAIMNKMYRMNNDYSSLMSDAQNFAFSLERERWHFDRCDEDIIIVFSLKDNIIFAVTGEKARQKISDADLTEIVMDSTPFFQHNPYMGLKHMIYGLRHALMSRFHVYRGEKHHLSEIYSYRRARARAVGSTYGEKGRIVGGYPSSADKIGIYGLLLCMGILTMFLFN